MFGFLLIDKPLGITSRDLVLQVRQRLRELGSPAVVGHCGTLDPLATGLMILAIGPATALTPWLQSGDKRYLAKFRFGVTSDSLDLETPLTAAPAISEPDRETFRLVCQKLTGAICQQPPKYSAIRIQGKRAYRLARQGRRFDVPTRTVIIHQLQVQEVVWPTVLMEIHCSGGTYIRTLGDDLAKLLGTRAVMTELRRTRASGLDLAQARTLDKWLAQTDPAPHLISVSAALQDMPHVVIGLAEAKRFRNGLISHQLQSALEDAWAVGRVAQPLDAELEQAPEQGGEVLVLLDDQRPVGIAYRRPQPNRNDHWRIKLNLAQWLEPQLF